MLQNSATALSKIRTVFLMKNPVHFFEKFILIFATLQKYTGESAVQKELALQAARLLDEYGNNILRLAYSYLHNSNDAEDIVQDTLLQFLKTAPSFAGPAHEKAWLLHVAGNLCKNRIRYNTLRETDELDETLAACSRTDLSFVWEAVKQLPEKYREVIHLYYCEDYSTAEVAHILKLNESTVRSHLRRGRQQLKTILKEEYDFEEI